MATALAVPVVALAEAMAVVDLLVAEAQDTAVGPDLPTELAWEPEEQVTLVQHLVLNLPDPPILVETMMIVLRDPARLGAVALCPLNLVLHP